MRVHQETSPASTEPLTRSGSLESSRRRRRPSWGSQPLLSLSSLLLSTLQGSRPEPCSCLH